MKLFAVSFSLASLVVLFPMYIIGAGETEYIAFPRIHIKKPYDSNHQRGADVEEFPVESDILALVQKVEEEVKESVADKVVTYAPFDHEDDLINLHWSITQLPFFPMTYKSEILKDGMMLYVKFRVGFQCFHVKLHKDYDNNVKVEDIKGALQCEERILFFP